MSNVHINAVAIFLAELGKSVFDASPSPSPAVSSPSPSPRHENFSNTSPSPLYEKI